ncbi:protein takeout-like [Homalodisca vitripennis]|uniref:protein takeout-like n=1 Tax=Homalodisca vitripennis TaxID=197043 RepID=UPI001EEC528B|nr:protein takeout-like [Homalodisca vitripennis]
MQPAHTVLLILLAGGYVTSLKPASEYFKICHRSDPELSTCIKNSIETLRPSLVKGIPELKLVPLDPLFIPKLEMQDGQGNFKFRQTLTDLYIHGLRNFEIQNITVDLDKNVMSMKCFTKTIDFEGDYEMAGKIMMLNLKGKGRASLNFTDVTTTAFIQNEDFQKNGMVFTRVESLKWIIEPQHAKFHFTNLFNGDKTLGDATNRFLNENWKEAFKIYRNLPEEAFGTLIKDLANKVYTLFPRNELYPE